MPRVRADDYDDKKNGILDAAAALFAQHAYSGCTMQDIAKACGVTKSMLYHYFSKKEDILYDILRQHLLRILTSLEEHRAAASQHADVNEYFRSYIETYLEKSKTARASHVVALHDRRYLTAAQQKRIVALERKILDDIGAILREINGDLDDGEYRAYSLLLIGMINWVELWYRRSGTISPDELYTMVTKLFLHGFARADVTIGAVTRPLARPPHSNGD